MGSLESQEGYMLGLEEYIVALEKRLNLVTFLANQAVKYSWNQTQLNNQLYRGQPVTREWSNRDA
jgi:hypothetical protein